MTPAAWARATLVLLGLSPFIVAIGHDWPLIGALASACDAWFAFQCERDPSRMLAWLPTLPVCSRCLGIYSGLGLGALLLWPRLSPRQLRLWVAAAAAIMVLDVGTEILGLRPPLAMLRLLTGFALAYPVGAALVWALRGAAEAQKSP